jgi:UDP-2-acetamido-2-deoxy-ribo-hexuluronate aminotransferase
MKNQCDPIAAKCKLPVVKDGAQSLGATYKGKQSCSLSIIGCSSFPSYNSFSVWSDIGQYFNIKRVNKKDDNKIRIKGICTG